MEAVPANGHAEGTALTPAQHAYYVGYVAVLVACFTPFKLLAYTLPTLFTAWMLYSAYTPAAGNRLAKIALVAAGVAAFHEILGHPFILSNYLIALVTFSAALPILVLDARSFASRELLQRMLLATTVMILIQGIWGSVQGINEAIHRGTFGENVGDWVEGTIHPALAAEMAGSNPMFAINMALMLIACLSLPGIFTGKRTKALVIGTFSFVLASVVHVFIFLTAAGALSVVLLRRARTVVVTERRSTSRLAVVLVLGFGLFFLGGQLQLADKFASDVLDFDSLKVPRAILLYRVATELPDDAPYQPYIGLGPGQFSSRASLIASGLYLGGPDTPKSVPLLPAAATPLAREYCIPLIYMIADAPEFTIGSTQQPFCSWLTIYTELGLPALLVIFWIAYRLVMRVCRRASQDPAMRMPAMAFSTGTILLVLLGIQEQYWEIPQAILIGLLLLKVIYGHIMYGAAPRGEPAPP